MAIRRNENYLMNYEDTGGFGGDEFDKFGSRLIYKNKNEKWKEKKNVKNFTRKSKKWVFAFPPEVLLAISTKLPAIAKVLEVISNAGNVMPLHIFSKGLRVNIDK